MVKKKDTPAAAPASAPQPTKRNAFKAPDELSSLFGVQHNEEQHIQGIVRTENVRTLLDSFGLTEKKDISFPFQHMKKGGGEIWSMRIEPAAGHTLDGAPIVGHQWIYSQQMPERVGAAG